MTKGNRHNRVLSTISSSVTKSSHRRQRRLANLFAASMAAVAVGGLFGGAAQAGSDTPDNVNLTATDLSQAGSYSTSALPLTTNDMIFQSGTYTGNTTFTINGANLTPGTLDDINTTQSLVITNTSATAGSITLSTIQNNVSGTAGDLVYVAAGGNLTLQNGTGNLTLNDNAYGNIHSNGNLTIACSISINTGGGLIFTGSGNTTVSGAISALPGLQVVIHTSGSVTFSGNNTNNYLQPQAGWLYITGSGTLGTSSVYLLTGGGNIDLGGTSQTAGLVNFNAPITIQNGNFTAPAYNINNGSGTTVISANLGGAGVALTETDPYTSALTLEGNNTYTGATTIAQGPLNLGGGTGNGSISSSSALVLGTCSTLNYTRTGTNTQTFNGTTMIAGGDAITGNNPNNTIALGSFTRSGIGSTIDFGSAGGTITTTNTTNINGIMGGYASFGGGATWAVAPATSGGAITGLATYTPADATASDYTNNNIDVTSSQAPGAAITPSSLRFNTAAAETLTLPTGTNVITTGGILVTSNVSTNASMITGGTLEGASGRDLVIIQNDTNVTSGALTIASVIADNGSPTGLTKSGVGTLILSAANTYSGVTTVNYGNLTLSNALALQNSTLNMNGPSTTSNGSGAGTLLFGNITGHAFTFGGLSGIPQNSTTNGYNISLVDTASNPVALTVGNNNASTTYSGVLSGNGTLTKIGTGILTLAGANTYTGVTTLTTGEVNLGVAETANTSGPLGKQLATAVGTIILNGGYLQYSALNVNDYSGRFSTAGNQQYNIDTNGQTITWATALTSSGGNLTQIGTGTLKLTGANTYTGTTTINGGTINLGNGGANGSLSASSALALGGGTLTYTRTGTNTQTFGGNTIINIGASALSDTVATDTLALGTITRNVGGAVDFTTITGNITTTTTTSSNGIMGGYATEGGMATWAVAPTSSGGNITGLATYANDTWASANNTTVTTNDTVGSGNATNSLRFNNAGNYTVTLAGTNTVATGGILMTSTVAGNNPVITGGTLAGASGADLVVIQNDTSGNLTIASAIANNNTATGLTKSGAGMAILNANNSYTGVTYVNAGTLEFTNEVSLYGNNTASWTAGNITVAPAAILAFNVGGTGQFTASDIGTLAGLGNATAGFKSGAILGLDTIAASFTYPNALANPNGGANILNLTKLSYNTLTLSGNNTYTGTTTVSYGTLALSGAGTLGSTTSPLTISAGSLDLGGTSQTVGAVTLTTAPAFGNTIQNGNLTATSYAASNGSGNIIVTANLGGTGGVTKTNGGFLILSGTNTYTGNTTLSAGEVSVSNASNLGTSASPIVFNGGTLQVTGTTLTNFTGIGHPIAYASNANVGLDINSAANTFIVDQILGQGTGTFTKSGVGTAVLNQANTYTGSTTVSAGTLDIVGAGTLGHTGEALAVSGGVLDLGGTTQSVGAITISAGATIQNGNLTATGLATPATSTGNTTILANLNLGSTAVSWSTGGTGCYLILGGNNTETSTWAINSAGGNLVLASNGALGNSTGLSNTPSGHSIQMLGNITTTYAVPLSIVGTLESVSGNNTYTGLVTSTNTFTLQADPGATLNLSNTGNVTDSYGPALTGFGNGTISGNITTSLGCMTKSGTGTWTLLGINSFGTGATVNGGTLALNGAGTLGNGSQVLTMSGGTLDLGTTNQSVTTATITAAPTYGGNTIQNGNLTIKTSLTATNAAGDTFVTANLTGAGTVTGNNTGGILTLSGNNSYSGVTTVTAGILEFTNEVSLYGNNTANWTAANLVVASGATAGFNVGGAGQFTSADISTLAALGSGTGGFKTGAAIGLDTTAGNFSYGNVIANPNSGSNVLGLNKLGINTLTLTGSNTYTGTTTVTAGTLALSGSGTLGHTGEPLTMAGGTLDLGGGSATVGNVTIASAATYGGNVIQNGSLTVNQTAGNITATNTSGNAMIAANLLGTATLTKSGAGILTLSGTNSYSGSTTIVGGELSISSSSNLGSGSLIFNGGTLQITGTSLTGLYATDHTVTYSGPAGLDVNNAANNYSVNMSMGGLGSNSFSKYGSGTATLTSSNTNTGTITVYAGTLAISGAGTLGGGTAPLSMAGGTVDLGGGNATVGAVTLFPATTGNTIQNGNLTGSSYINVNTGGGVSGNTVVTANLLGTGSLTEQASATLTLEGNNTYSGGTNINYNAVIDLGGSTGNGSLNPSGNLSFGSSGTLIYTTAGTNTQTFNSLIMGWSSGWGSISTTNSNDTINLGNLAYTNSGYSARIGTLDFGSTGTITIGYTTNVNGIMEEPLGSGNIAFATFGNMTTWAVAPSASGGAITGLLSGSYTTTTTAGTNGSNYTNLNIDVTSSPILAGVINPNTLRFNTAGANTLTLAMGPNIISAGGILVTNNVGSNPTIITGGNLEGTNTGDLIINQNNSSGNLTISSVIANNTGATNLIKNGTGTLVLAAANTYTGYTFLNGGILNLGCSTNPIPSTNSIYFYGGILQYSAAYHSDNSADFNNTQYNAFKVDTNGQNVTWATPFGGGTITDLTKYGAGILTMAGNNSYSGVTILNGGGINLGYAEYGSGGPIGKVAGGGLTAGFIYFNGGYLQYSSLNQYDYSVRFATSANQQYSVDTNGYNVTWATALNSSGGSLTKLGGAGILTLSAANTFNGNTTNTSIGAIDLQNALALQNSTLITSGIAFDAGVMNHAFTLGGLSGSGNLTLADTGNNPVALSVGNNNAGTTYSAILSGNGSLTKIGAGSLTLTGANTYTGGTTVNAGTLALANTTGSATGTGTVTVNAGVLGGGGTMAPTGTTGTLISIAAGAQLAPSFGTGNTTTTLHANGSSSSSAAAFNIAGGTTLNYNFGAPGTSDLLAVTGNVTLAAGNDTLNITQLAGFGAGNYTLISATNLADNVGNWTLPSSTQYVYALVGNSTALVLDVTPSGPITVTWNGNNTAAWDTISSNWQGSAHYADGDLVVFADIALGNFTVDLGGVTFYPGSVTVNNSNSAYSIGDGTIGGNASLTKNGTNTLTLTGNNTYSGGTTVNAGTLDVATATNGLLSGSSVANYANLQFDGAQTLGAISGNGTTTISGTGSLTVGSISQTNLINNGAVSLSGSGTVATLSDTSGLGSAGNTTVGSTGNLTVTSFAQASLINNGITSIIGTGTIGQLGGTGSLNIGNGSLANTVTLATAATSGVLGGIKPTQGLVTIASGSTLDITNNALLLNYGNGTSPLAAVANAVAYGAGKAGNASSNGAIISSTVNTSAAGKYAVGYADHTEISSIPTGNVEVAYTLAGDANLDGSVDILDYQQMAPHYDEAGTYDWSQGDFNHDGHVDILDYQAMAPNYDTKLTAGTLIGADSLAASASLTAADLARPIGGAVAAAELQTVGGETTDGITPTNITTAIPEPASLSLLLLGGIPLLGRRRRKARKTA